LPAVRARVWIGAAVLVAVVVGGLAVTARAEWPRARLGAPGDALARVVLPRLAGQVASVAVRSADGAKVPVQLRDGKLLPLGKVGSGEWLSVELTVRRPSWAGWLVGDTERRSFKLETPSAHLLGRWLQVKAGTPVMLAFDTPVSVVSFGTAPPHRVAKPQSTVPVGLVASGSHSAGAVEVTAVPRTWELLPAPVRVNWFPARPFLQLLAAPRPGTMIGPKRQLTLTFSSPVAAALGTRRPRLFPALPGGWRLLDAHTLAFRPRGLGFPLGTRVRVELPRAARLARESGAKPTRTLSWQVPSGSNLRLQQLLAKLGYLPLDWQAAAAAGPPSTGAELVAARSPPRGHFSWRYPHTPRELRRLWRPGEANEITRGAVMMFQQTHRLTVDGLPGPAFWQALIADAITAKRRTAGYNYVFVHRKLPQSLNLWHNGHVILRSPGNTGVPAAPTELGTFPVFEHVPVGTMAGTNPNGTRYNDPGIRYISYFHDGEAIHAFKRDSFGTPQSLGCVELPLAAAAKTWSYTPIGTLVTIEN
jgi:peptidoglycan hydrolase-like protein with peptidoglycan-binding domain